MHWKGRGNKRPWPLLQHHLVISLMGPRKTRKACQCRPSPGHLYSGTLEHEQGVHSIRTRLSGC